MPGLSRKLQVGDVVYFSPEKQTICIYGLDSNPVTWPQGNVEQIFRMINDVIDFRKAADQLARDDGLETDPFTLVESNTAWSIRLRAIPKQGT